MTDATCEMPRPAGYLSHTAGRPAAGKQTARYGLRLAAGVGLVLWLVRREGWARITSCLAGVQPEWFALIVAVYLVGQTLCAWKWGLLAGSLGFRRSYRFYWVNYLGAMFGSLFLPTSVGGDVYRAMTLAQQDGDWSGATVSVLADRGTGVLAMVWIATLAARSAMIPLPQWAGAALALACGVLTFGFVLPFWYRPRWARSGFLGRVLACWEDPQRLLVALQAAFLFQALLCVIFLLIGKALALSVDPAFYFLLCPLISLAAMAPISINGFGIREAALVALFPLAAAGPDRAVAFGLTWSAMVMVSGLIGGLMLMGADSAGWHAEGAGGSAAGGVT